MRDKIVINGKYGFKTAKWPTSQEKKVRDNRENSAKKKSAEFERVNVKKAIMLRWPYLLHPPLDRADFWIYYAYHKLLITDCRDLKEHNLFDRIITCNLLENKRKYTCRAILVTG